ncbi:MAG: hypothetical protein A4E48_01133 [Methanosaeta sp. PtaU1.Bin060]|nr:MAG: hypothetical protein A4E48_01133 [Methanosaeta sp. PtaU1.Bin060]
MVAGATSGSTKDFQKKVEEDACDHVGRQKAPRTSILSGIRPAAEP